MNRKYRVLTFILIIGYGFFFTTRLWNIDDRPRFNSWETTTIGNAHGRISITEVIYISPIDALDIILEKTSFMSDEVLMVEAAVHRLDGGSDTVPITVVNEESNRNITRQFLRIYLDDDNLDWHFVEVVLIDEADNNRQRLTMDWRLVERTDDITTAESYDLSFDELVAASESPVAHEIHDHDHNHNHESQYVSDHPHDHGDLTHSHAPDLSLEGINRSLDIAFTEYAIVREMLEDDPENNIMLQSLAFYESEIQRLEALLEEYHNESN